MALFLSTALLGCIDNEGLPTLGSTEESIAGGTPTAPGELAGVGRVSSLIGGCTGTLVAGDRVLTAAHCVCPDTFPADACLTTASFTLYDVVRRDDPRTATNEEGTRGSVSFAGTVVGHPQYGPQAGYRQDYAVLTLDRRATDLAVVTPLGVGGRHGPAISSPLTMVGYGRTNGPDGECELTSSLKLKATVELGAIRTEGAGRSLELVNEERHVCRGDSGGPAVDADGLVQGVASTGDLESMSRYVATYAVGAWLEANGVPIDGVGFDRNDIWTPLLSNWCGHAGSTSGTADFNDDDKLDVWCHDPMVAGGQGRTWVALSTGTSYVARAGTSLYDPWLSGWCGSPGETFGVADFDDDGDDDLWCRGAPGTTGGGKVWVARSTGAGFTTGAPVLTNWCGAAGETLGVADFDGVNGADLYCRDTLGTQGRIWVARSTGSGFTTGAPWISNWCGSAGETLGTGTFNDDTKADLYCYSAAGGSGRAWVALSTGSGFTSGANGNLWSPWITGWCGHAGSGFGVADFTGEGRTDLYCNDGVGSGGNVWVAVSAGTSFASTAWQPWATNWCSHAGASFGTGDMDGDGAADLLCRDNQHLWVGLSNEVNGFTGDPFTPKLRGWCTFEQFGLTDLDGDGAADPICRDLPGAGSLGRFWVALTRHWGEP